MTLKDFGLEFPKEKKAEALYDYIYRVIEALDVILGEKIGEDSLSDDLKSKLGLGGE